MNNIEKVGKEVKKVSEDKKDFISANNAGWWNGCTECDAYHGEIHDIISDYGHTGSLKFVREKMR